MDCSSAYRTRHRYCEPPSIAIDAAGNAIAVWSLHAGGGNKICAAHYDSGNGWAAPQSISNNTEDYYSPRIAFDAAGNAIAVWPQWDVAAGTYRWNIWAARYASGSGWTAPQRVSSDSMGDAWGPKIASDSTGNATVVWVQHDGGYDESINWKVYAARYVSGSGWTTPQLIKKNDDTHLVKFLQIAVDAAGNAIAVWCQCDGIVNNDSNCTIWAARYE